MQPTLNPIFDLAEGIYISTYHKRALVYVKPSTPYVMYYCFINVDTHLLDYAGFAQFNPGSIVARGLIPLILEPIPDDVVISTLYPELFI